ncbi:MAG TPA: hypothetical protein VFL46_13325 [Phycicoccus sp.]|nr:hypothetical protein [Phycicoccus sp.]
MTEEPGRSPDGQEPYPEEGEAYPDEGRGNGWKVAFLVLLVLVVVGAVVWLFLRPGPDDTATPSPSPSATTSSAGPTTTSPSPSPSPSETADLTGFSLEPVVENGFPELGDPIGIGTDVRVGHHTGYDRVVFQFAEPGEPSYRVEYTDDPRSQGSGDTVKVAGDAVLQVTITSVGIPGPGTPAPTPTTPPLTGTVFAQVDGIWGGFEGYGESFLGINGEKRPFKVTLLQNPTRLVIDVANG